MVWGDIEPDHTKCRLPEYTELRQTWGCDADAKEPIFDIACTCDDPKICKRCEGHGRILIYRCPFHVLSQDRFLGTQVEEWFRAYIIFSERNTPPILGGWLDQSAKFTKICDIIDAERGHYTAVEQEEREREQKEAANAARAREREGQKGRRR